MNLRVKIISTGEPQKTSIINADSGEYIGNIKSVSWQIDAHNHGVAQLDLYDANVNIESEAHCATCGTPLKDGNFAMIDRQLICLTCRENREKDGTTKQS